MASIYRHGKKGPYYITYFVRPGVRKTLKGCKDKAATEALARKLEADAMLRREGVIDARADRYAAAEAKPLNEHVADLAAALKAKGVTALQAGTVKARVTHILGLCKAERISQISLSGVQNALGTIREVGASVKSRNKGVSLQTCNHYLRALKQFTRWLWRDGRAREDALVHLAGYNVQLDRRHDRRALTDDELARLIRAAEKGQKVRAMTGPERAMLYQLAVGTGFRANELRSLTPESFDLDADPPTVTVQAGYSKRRRMDVQPIRCDLADLLRPWLAGKKAGHPVFNMPDKPIKLIRPDLDAAHQAWLKEARSEEERSQRRQSDFLEYRDGEGRVADFHALRHTYISRLVASGANIKVAQELARHSTPTLTLGRYAHVQLVDQTRALDALPSIEPTRADDAALAATGTDDAVAVADEPPPARSALAARRRPGTPQAAITGQDGEGEEDGQGNAQVVANATTCAQLSTYVNGAGGGIRTPNPRFTKPVLYR